MSRPTTYRNLTHECLCGSRVSVKTAKIEVCRDCALPVSVWTPAEILIPKRVRVRENRERALRVMV